MYASSWTELISIIRSRKTNSRGRGRLRLSFKRGGISGRTDTTIISPGETMLGNRGPLILKWLMRCSENQYIKFWRRSRTSCSLNGQITWVATLRNAIKAFTANTTRTDGTSQRIIELCGIIWISWFEREG